MPRLKGALAIASLRIDDAVLPRTGDEEFEQVRFHSPIVQPSNVWRLHRAGHRVPLLTKQPTTNPAGSAWLSSQFLPWLSASLVGSARSCSAT